MIHKNINKIIFFLVTLSCYSCQTSNFFEKKDFYDINSDDIIEDISFIDTKNNNLNKNDYLDYYRPFFIKDLKKFNSSNLLAKIDRYVNKYEKSRIIIPVIFNDNLVVLRDNNVLNYYDTNNFSLLNTTTINFEIDSKINYPISLSKLDNKMFISYSDGLLLAINYDGEIIWKKKFNDISKTPIKVFNDNIIMMLTDRLVSIDPNQGFINWEFIYKNDESNLLNSNGGEIIHLNHLLFFILPNFKIGQIDTIFGEKNDINLSNTDFNNSLKNLSKSLHTYKNLLSFLDNNKFINTIDIDNNKFLLKNIKIDNILSSYFFNNSLFCLTINNKLKSINIENNKIFWKTDLSKYISLDNKIISITSFNKSLLILFDNGILIQLNAIDGSFISEFNIKVKNIIRIIADNNFLFIFNNKKDIYIFPQ